MKSHSSWVWIWSKNFFFGSSSNYFPSSAMGDWEIWETRSNSWITRWGSWTEEEEFFFFFYIHRVTEEGEIFYFSLLENLCPPRHEPSINRRRRNILLLFTRKSLPTQTWAHTWPHYWWLGDQINFLLCPIILWNTHDSGRMGGQKGGSFIRK